MSLAHKTEPFDIDNLRWRMLFTVLTVSYVRAQIAVRHVEHALSGKMGNFPKIKLNERIRDCTKNDDDAVALQVYFLCLTDRPISQNKPQGSLKNLQYKLRKVEKQQNLM